MIVMWFSRRREYRADAGGVGHGLKRLVRSHPPLTERIAALEADR